MWILDPTFSVINWVLIAHRLVEPRLSWLGNPHLAMVSIIIVNTWRGMPFYGITLLAGLQTISPELYEAADHRRRRPLASASATSPCRCSSRSSSS